MTFVLLVIAVVMLVGSSLVLEILFHDQLHKTEDESHLEPRERKEPEKPEPRTFVLRKKK
jgi:hypothetical protein